jgi:hypothetical protein
MKPTSFDLTHQDKYLDCDDLITGHDRNIYFTDDYVAGDEILFVNRVINNEF